MNKLIIISGCSASGKDTIAKFLINVFNYKMIVSTTTRPIREGEVEGREYYFISHEEALERLNSGKFIEHREYITENSDKWIYGIEKSAIDLNDDNNYIAIVDINGKNDLINFAKEQGLSDRVITFYIDCPIRERLIRSLNREPNADSKNILEMCSRTIRDYNEIEVFKDQYNYVIDNSGRYSLEEIINKINNVVRYKI